MMFMTPDMKEAPAASKPGWRRNPSVIIATWCLGSAIAPQAEMIRAIVLEDSPCSCRK